MDVGVRHRERFNGPTVPCLPLREAIERDMLLEGRCGLETRYATRFGLSRRQAERRLTRVLSAEDVDVYLADTFAALLEVGHLEMLWSPEELDAAFAAGAMA